MWLRRLIALAAIAAVAVGVWLILGSPEPGEVDEQGAEVTELTIDSKAVGESEEVDVVVPKGGSEGRPLLVFLHGRGQDQSSWLEDEVFAALADQGDRAPVIAFPDGGESSYWHDRADGDWGSYVTDEVIPEVADRFDVDSKRVAVGGISMGGFGAYDLARLNPGRFCAIGGHSPALWATAGETAPGAFDDAEDFAAHDVVGGAAVDPSPYLGRPVWLDAGDEDPFAPGDQAFADALQAAGADLTVKTWPGGHEDDYWREHWDSYLKFYARALADC